MDEGFAGTVRVEQDGPTRILVMEYGAVNTIVLGIRVGLAQALLDAEMDSATGSVVVIGAGGNFCGGADLVEFARGTAMSPPSLHGHIIPFMEAMSKPVVAAIEGFALGGGLELALGCHARVASDSARVGLPETNFGLIPGAGGSVRLPRALGVITAARMIVKAEIVAARDLKNTLLFEEVTMGDVRAAAVTLARKLAAMGNPLPRLRDVPVARFDTVSLDALRKLPRPSTRATALAIGSVVRAAEMPFDTALAADYADFSRLLMGDESAALRHVFQAGRAAQKVSDLPPGLRARKLRHVGIAGSGTLADTLMKAGTKAGYDMACHQDAPLPSGGSEGKVTESSVLAICDDVFEAIDTSAGAIAANPSGYVRLHAFAQARVVEVVHGDGVAAESVLGAMQFVRRIGMSPVCVRPGPGLLIARLAICYFSQAIAMASEGIATVRIDRALEAFGMRKGPFATMDVIGFDTLKREHPPTTDWNAVRATSGDTPDADAPDDNIIARRCVLALVNEGARALQDGTAQRPGDIDFAMVEACGFPRGMGGPMFWAEARGLPLTLVEIARLARETGDPFWTPAALLKDRASDGSLG
jgi:3-hydroxyacyl-CoA dehydrogenase